MNNQLQIFKNSEFGEVRAILKDNEPYFIGNEVAKILGYKNTRDALIKHVDEEDKDVVKRDTLGGSQDVTVINESGLYSLILSSKLPGAKKFKRWVTSEVLPSIRKNGMYATDELLSNPEFAIQVFMELKKEKEEKQKLIIDNMQKEQLIGELKPKADYLDLILQSQDTLTVTQIAADYGMSAKALNKILSEENIQRSVSGQWILYKKYMNQGLTKSETIKFRRSDGREDYKLLTRWTQKGRVLIHRILESRGIKANIDKEAKDEKNKI